MVLSHGHPSPISAITGSPESPVLAFWGGITVRPRRCPKPRGANRGPRRARRWLDGVETRRASSCHPERAAVFAANEGPRPAKPSYLPLPLPSQIGVGFRGVIPEGPVHARFSRGWAEIIPDWRGFERLRLNWRRVDVPPIPAISRDYGDSGDQVPLPPPRAIPVWLRV
jgi:hypothetical protein